MSPVRAKRSGRARTPPLRLLTDNTLVGTREVIEAVVKESASNPTWRPVRAAAVAALDVKLNGTSRRWMTTGEFAAWVASFGRNRRNEPHKAVDIAPSRRKAIMAGAPISAIEALAIAHYRAGLPVPIPELGAEPFEAWFSPRFCSVRPVAKALGVSPNTLSDQLRGYALSGGRRVARPPNLTLLRALDWCWRVGPFSPYGDRPALPAFPGQLKEETTWA